MRAWELIADPERWTQDAWARDEDGAEVMLDSQRAVCWCASAALDKVYGQEDDATSVLMRIAYSRRYGKYVTTDNDSPGMTAAIMSSRLRVVEEEVLKEMETPNARS